MASYLARVELFGADADNYESLYEGMSALGFSKTITFPDGGVNNLPTGTYVGTFIDDVSVVRERIKVIANPLSNKPAAIFVCDYNNWAAYLYPNV